MRLGHIVGECKDSISLALNLRAAGTCCHPFHREMVKQRSRDQVASFRTKRDAEPGLKRRLADSSLNLCCIYYLSPSEMALTELLLILHGVVSELDVAINITFLVQHEVF